jgi:hypothetical protein
MNEWYEEEYLEKFKLYFTVHNPFYYEDGVYYDLSDTNSHLSLNTNLYYYLKDKSYRIEYNENDIIHSIFCKDGFKVVLFKINNKHYLNLINNESTTTEIESLKLQILTREDIIKIFQELQESKSIISEDDPFGIYSN